MPTIHPKPFRRVDEPDTSNPHRGFPLRAGIVVVFSLEGFTAGVVADVGEVHGVEDSGVVIVDVGDGGHLGEEGGFVFHFAEFAGWDYSFVGLYLLAFVPVYKAGGTH